MLTGVTKGTGPRVTLSNQSNSYTCFSYIRQIANEPARIFNLPKGLKKVALARGL